MNDNNNSRRGFLERMLPAALPSILVALVGQMLLAIWWARGESERITHNMDAINTMKFDVDNFRTPLAARVLKAEEQLVASSRSTEQWHQATQATIVALSTRLDSIDSKGTRGLESVAQTQQRLVATVERSSDRLLLLDKKLSELDAIKSDLKRLEEQQSRIVQAIDANYNLINEHIRSHPGTPRR